jgi:hypothetical protein
MKKPLNKIALASIAAVVAVPVVASAQQSPFTDVVDQNSHAAAINNLVERGIISGFGDGTYRPNATLTRGQAAKILANVLGLNVTNTTQTFTDVPSSHQYAGAINALVQAGIVSGYSDGTFKPGMPLTRGQMAKIIVEAFDFPLATELTHSFADVSSANGYKYYIQTLVNLGITVGTSPTTYSPTAAVKRGQMATFIVRAEVANNSNPTTDDSATVTPPIENGGFYPPTTDTSTIDTTTIDATTLDTVTPDVSGILLQKGNKNIFAKDAKSIAKSTVTVSAVAGRITEIQGVRRYS